MRPTTVIAAFAAALCLSAGVRADAASTTLFYPTQDKASFSIVAPDTWTMEPAEEEGGFVNLSSPSGALLCFRTVPGNEDELKVAIEDAVKFVRANYNKVQIGKAEDAAENGVQGFSSVGSAFDKTDGRAVTFVLEWLDLKNGNIAEIWFFVDNDDKKGLAEAGKILDSFKAR